MKRKKIRRKKKIKQNKKTKENVPPLRGSTICLFTCLVEDDHIYMCVCVCVVQLMKQVLINPTEDHHHV